MPRRGLHQEDRGRQRGALGRERVGATASNPSERAFTAVEEWRSRSLDGSYPYPYVYVDGIYLKHSWGGSYENVAVMVNIGVNGEGCREAIGAAEGLTESPGVLGVSP